MDFTDLQEEVWGTPSPSMCVVLFNVVVVPNNGALWDINNCRAVVAAILADTWVSTKRPVLGIDHPKFVFLPQSVERMTTASHTN